MVVTAHRNHRVENTIMQRVGNGYFSIGALAKGQAAFICLRCMGSFFLSLPAARVERYAIGIYLAAAVISSVISCCILELAGYRHSLGIAVLIFIGGLAITAYQWHKKGREYLLKRYQEIPKIILERKEREHSENE